MYSNYRARPEFSHLAECDTLTPDTKIFKVTVRATDIAEFLVECEKAEWFAFDTGERIMTDEGPDAEAVVCLEAKPMPKTKRAGLLIERH